MAFILYGNIILKDKRVYSSLENIFGVGLNKIKLICSMVGIPMNAVGGSLTKKQEYFLKLYFRKYWDNSIGVNLKKLRKYNLRHLIQNRSYRGLRHRLNLPVRGQRTHTNARTQKKRSFKINRYPLKK